MHLTGLSHVKIIKGRIVAFSFQKTLQGSRGEIIFAAKILKPNQPVKGNAVSGTIAIGCVRAQLTI